MNQAPFLLEPPSVKGKFDVPVPMRAGPWAAAGRRIRRVFGAVAWVVVAHLPATEVLGADFEAVPKTTGHAFACIDYSQGKVFFVSAEGKVEWEYPAKGCCDLWALPGGSVLFSSRNGVQEVSRDKKVVFSYDSKSEIYACQRLPGGNTFVGECNTGRLLEVNPRGQIAKEVRLLPEGKDGGHYYIRNARVLTNGNYLVSHYGLQVVREYDPRGKLLREIPAAGGPYSAIRLPGGNTLVSCGFLPNGARVFEADPDGKTVWEVRSKDLPGMKIDFMSGLHRLPNGNTVMSTLSGRPHLIEVTPDKTVVWTFADPAAMRSISSVQLLDVPGDATRGEILH